MLSKSGANVFAGYSLSGTAIWLSTQDAQTWATEIEGTVLALAGSAATYAFETRADMDAYLTPANRVLISVWNDPVADNNGYYRKVGSSGSGSYAKVGNLPFSFQQATNAGEGSADWIAATTPSAVQESQIILLPIVATNTIGQVKVAFNGGAALTIKTNSGNNIAVGGLVAGMMVLGVKIGSTFRLVNDQVSTAIIAQAEAAAATAVAAEAGVLIGIGGSGNLVPDANFRKLGYTWIPGGGGTITPYAGDEGAGVLLTKGAFTTQIEVRLPNWGSSSEDDYPIKVRAGDILDVSCDVTRKAGSSGGNCGLYARFFLSDGTGLSMSIGGTAADTPLGKTVRVRSKVFVPAKAIAVAWQVYYGSNASSANGSVAITNIKVEIARPRVTASPAVNIKRDLRDKRSNDRFVCTRVGVSPNNVVQSHTFDELNQYLYTHHVSSTYVAGSEYAIINRYLCNGPKAVTALDSSTPSNLLGHQGLSTEYLDGGSVRLWTSASAFNTLTACGLYAVRFRYNAGADPDDITTFKLFPSGSSTGSSTPTVSDDGQFLVAKYNVYSDLGLAANSLYLVRVFSLYDINQRALATTPGDIVDCTDLALFEWTIGAESTDTQWVSNAFRGPLQDLLCCGQFVYALFDGDPLAAGASAHKHVLSCYAIDGAFVDVQTDNDVGKIDATADGDKYEMEGLAWFTINGERQMTVGVASGASGARKFRVYGTKMKTTLYVGPGALQPGILSQSDQDFAVPDGEVMWWGSVDAAGSATRRAQMTATQFIPDVMITPGGGLGYGPEVVRTIASDAVSAAGTSNLRVDTEAAASTDNLSSITGGVEGQVLLVHTVNSGRDVTLIDGANLKLEGNCTLGNTTDVIVLLYDKAGYWKEQSRSINS